MDLSHAAELVEFAEHQGDRLANPQVRIHLDAIVPGLAVADSDSEEQLTAPRLLAQRLERALPQ